MKRLLRFIFTLCVLIVAVSACATPAATSGALGPRPTVEVRTPTPQPATDREAIEQLVFLEGRGVVTQDIAGLMDLWAPDASIVDAKHTPNDSEDDARWNGRDAIRDRYVVLVFPGNPAAAGPRDLDVVITGDTAEATSTTAIGGEVSPGGDRWRFVRRDGRWWIAELTYNLEK